MLASSTCQAVITLVKRQMTGSTIPECLVVKVVCLPNQADVGLESATSRQMKQFDFVRKLILKLKIPEKEVQGSN